MDTKQAQHTPGPWKWDDVPGAGIQISANVPKSARVGLYTYRTETDDGDTGMLFTLGEAQIVRLADARWVQFSKPEWDEMQAANARLIAAAPDLLAACRGMVGLLGALEEERGLKMLGVSVDAMNVAIAKAEGPPL